MSEQVILRPKQVLAAGYASSRTSLWRAVKAGRFPQPIRLGPNSLGFVKADLDAWLQSQRQQDQAA